MKRKSGKYLILGLILTLMLGMIACGKDAKIEKQLTLGQTCMDAGDYVAAITAYEEAISLDKYEIAGYEGLVNAMAKDNRSDEEIKAVVLEVTVALEELKATETGIQEEKKTEAENFYLQTTNLFNGNIEEELGILYSAIAVLGEESQLVDAYETKTEALVKLYLEEYDFENAKRYVDLLAITLSSSSRKEELETLIIEKEKLVQIVTEENEREQSLEEILWTVRGYIEEKDWKALINFNNSEKVSIIMEQVNDEGRFVYIFDGGTTGFGIGFYPTGINNWGSWYLGEYVDGLRSGYGGSYWAIDDCVDIYEGPWIKNVKNDLSGDCDYTIEVD